MTTVHKVDTRPVVGVRVVVTGMAGAGKSTFSRMLSKKTGLPLIHLDLHSWNPGWERVPEAEFLQKQHALLAAERWIVDSNDVADELIFARADTLVVMNTPWWVCSWRAFRRGLRRPPDTQLPEGCPESVTQRLSDEWKIVWQNWRDRNRVRDRELSRASLCEARMAVHVFDSKQNAENFLDHAGRSQTGSPD